VSKITFAPNASGTGTLTVAAPNTNSDYTLTLPTNTGTILTTASSGLGKVLQVLSATDLTERATTSTTFVTASNTLSVTITPASASSKFLILANTVGYKSSASTYGQFTIYRDATNLASGSQALNLITGQGYVTVGMNFLDSPATTSPITYQVYLRSTDGNNVYINAYTASSSVGSITVLEIAG